MLVCRRCGRRYEADERHCTADGTLLVQELNESLARQLPETDTLPIGRHDPSLLEDTVREAPEVVDSGNMIGEYRVEGLIGEGGMGVVYAARHLVIGRRVAIKVVHRYLCTRASVAERFINEARAVNQIRHPNIVDIFTIGTLEDGRIYLVMELLQGVSLADRMRRKRLSYLEVLEVLDGVATALEAAHAHGIIHRDLKPENIFLLEDRSGVTHPIKLLDFGIAKLTGETDLRLAKTSTGEVVGTPLYISPEQAKAKPVDARSDIYSLGVLAYEMFLGAPPFVADSAVQVMTMHIRQTPPPLSKSWPAVPPAIDAMVGRMLAKDPASRPTLAEVRATLAGHAQAGGAAKWPSGEVPTITTRGDSLGEAETFPNPRVAVDRHWIGAEAVARCEEMRRGYPPASRDTYRDGFALGLASALGDPGAGAQLPGDPVAQRAWLDGIGFVEALAMGDQRRLRDALALEGGGPADYAAAFLSLWRKAEIADH